jgi:hypothetical protein
VDELNIHKEMIDKIGGSMGGIIPTNYDHLIMNTEDFYDDPPKRVSNHIDFLNEKPAYLYEDDVDLMHHSNENQDGVNQLNTSNHH